MNKKGIEIGITFLVTLIIALVVFGFAIAFAFKFFGKAKEYQSQVDQNTRSQIEGLIVNSGGRVAVYPTQISLHSGEDEIAGIGILNIRGSDTNFTINVNCTEVVFGNGTSRINPPECDNVKITYIKQYTIKNNNNEIVPVVIKNSGAVIGTYIIDARVTYQGGAGDVYGGVQKIYLKSI